MGTVLRVLAVAAILASAGCNTSPSPSVLGPGCTGSPGGSCSPYPEGAGCPGPPTVCVECAAGVFVPALSRCLCTSGKWDCVAPDAGTIQCANPVEGSGFFGDPACSIPFVSDGGGDGGAP
jgi:hypothetical protein